MKAKLTKEQKLRKQQLDQMMSEYYYQKNSIKDTMEFLAFMYREYTLIFNIGA